MPGTLTLLSIKTSGAIVEKQIKPSDFRAIKEAIGGGPLETVPLLELVYHNGKTHKCVAYCDEEGKLKGLPLNREATARWYRGLSEVGINHPDDFLVGDIAFIFGDPKLMREL